MNPFKLLKLFLLDRGPAARRILGCAEVKNVRLRVLNFSVEDLQVYSPPRKQAHSFKTCCN